MPSSHTLQKLVLDSLILHPKNEYLASLEEGHLKMCCLDELGARVIPYVFLFEQKKELYENEGQVDTVEVYVAGDSYFKVHLNHDPTVEAERMVYGEIHDPKLLRPSKVKIGMKKKELLNLFFHVSPLFDQVKRLSLYEDEYGNFWTTFVFEKEQLSKVVFDSYNDWVDPELN